MTDIDPLKVVRNQETLSAYRRYRRQLRAAAFPWTLIALLAATLEIGLFLRAAFRNDFHDLSLISAFLVFVLGASSGVASVRIWRFRRTHRLQSPPPSFRGGTHP